MTQLRVSDDARPLPEDNQRRSILAALRRDVGRIEGFAARSETARLPLGAPRLDGLLGGGLTLAACHDLVEARPGDGAALSGFALALIARTGASLHQRRRGIVWIIERLMALEYGRLYPPGLAALGIDPGLFLLVTVETQQEALAAAEDALRARGPAITVVETHGGGKALDGFSCRRLSLAAETGQSLGLLLRHGPAPPLPLGTRLALASAPSAIPCALGGLALPGPPVFDCTLVKNRLGPSGRVLLRFDPHSLCFSESLPERMESANADIIPALPRPVVPFPGNRPSLAA